MNSVTLYFRYMRLNYLAGLQYKGWWFQVITVLLITLTDPLEPLLMFDRFGAIGEWSLARIMLIYGIAICAFGLAELVARGFDYFPFLIRTGEFDRILLRPRGTFVQVMGLRFHIHRLARVVLGLVFVLMSLQAAGFQPALSSALLLLGGLAGTFLLYFGLFVLFSALVFFTVAPLDIIYIFTNGSYQILKTPPQYLPSPIRNVFTFIVPLLPTVYLPASAALGWGTPVYLGALALPIGAAFFGVSILLWRFGVSRYKSSGS